MTMVATSLSVELQIEQLDRLKTLLDRALSDSDELHHRIREIQLRVAELSASMEKARNRRDARTSPS
jgi:uncharacterized protein YggE